jgi:oligopeptide/dipeptide ABC transporter ATP-binding protein
MTSLLEVEGLTTSFPAQGRSVAVVDGISFSLAAGEVLALVGESGCGKSVTALSVMRLVPKPGQVAAKRLWLDGKELLALSVPQMRRVRGSSVAMIFQEPMTSLNPVIRVGPQVMESVLLHESVSKQAARARALELFARVGIPDPGRRLEAFPHQLSGGLKQRVMIAMALATRPKLLIADEPTTALDVTIQAQILELLREVQRESNTAILLITHDLGVVNELADRIAVMYAGKVAEQGSRMDVLKRPSHPYTKGLLRAIPALARKGERLYEIAGTVPAPRDFPRGCRFCTRCPEVFEPCAEQVPEATVLGPGHAAYCHALGRAPAGPSERTHERQR